MLGMLYGIIGEAREVEMPCGQNVLSGVASEADMEEGEIVCPTIGEAVRSENTYGRVVV